MQLRYAHIVTPMFAILMIALLVSPAIALAATDPTVNITVYGADGQPLENAKVTVYDSAGTVVFEGNTDENGTVSLTVSETGLYLVVVKSEYYILDTINVTGDMNVTIDASTMYHANLTSTPKNVDVKVVLLAFDEVELTMTTNVTVYAPSDINVTYPSEIVEFPYKYVLSKIEYDGRETNETTVTLDMTEDYVVTAYYEKTFYITLEYWMVILLVIIIVAALAIAWSAGARQARAMISEWREKNRKYVKKK